MTSDDELLALAEKACGEHASCQCNELSGDELSQGKTCESCHADYAFHRVATIDRIKTLIQRSKRLKEAETLLADWKAAFESIRTTDSPEYSEPPFGMPWMFTVKFLGARVK